MTHNIPHTEEAKDKIRKAKLGVPLIKKRRKLILLDGLRHWKCSTCLRVLPEGSFYKSKRTWNGITNECRNCHIKCSIKTRDKANSNRLGRESMRRQRAKDPEKYRERERMASKKRLKDIRFYARQCLNNAVSGGIISKPKQCSKCGLNKKLTAHHRDYMKPLEVEWFCYECHGNR